MGFRVPEDLGRNQRGQSGVRCVRVWNLDTHATTSFTSSFTPVTDTRVSDLEPSERTLLCQ